MKRCLLLIWITLSLSPRIWGSDSFDSMLDSLDAIIQQANTFEQKKEQRIHDLRHRYKSNATQEELYMLNSLLYDEYYVYDADSAISLAKKNLFIAKQMSKPEWETEWNIKLSFVYAATGLLAQAEEQIAGIDASQLPINLRVEYYRQNIYILSHWCQYSGDSEIAKEYGRRQEAYKDSICDLVPKNDPLYLWQKAWGPEAWKVKDQLINVIEEGKLDSRFDAMNAYCLAHIYNEEGNEQEKVRYLILSAIADIKSCNRDISSLEELAKWLFTQGDVDHCYNYINYCMQQDRLYHNRIHVVSLSETLNDIHRAYQERSNRQRHMLVVVVCVLFVVFAILTALVFFVMRQMHHLRQSRSNASLANSQLKHSNEELLAARSSLSEANNQLEKLNQQLSEANAHLRDANYIKEEIIGYVFSVCSQYISKMEDMRKRVLRQAKTGQLEEIRKTAESPIQQSELKEFYQTFDQVFLNIYPDFIEDFNSLLRPEERITPKEGELLNTELRIYALVRLGINDSVKISEFLHCSAQTVYNNRLRCRNKAIVPKAEFAATVASLGKVERVL